MLLFVIFRQDDMLGEEQLEQKRKNNELGDSSGGARERTSVDRDVKLDNNINMYEAERNGLSDGGGQVATSGSESSQDGRLARIRAQEFEEEPRSSLIRDPNLDSSEGASFTIQVSVSDPVKQVADHSFLPGVTTSHYEYLVTSMFFDNLSTSGKHHEVRRRFNDFVVGDCGLLLLTNLLFVKLNAFSCHCLIRFRLIPDFLHPGAG